MAVRVVKARLNDWRWARIFIKLESETCYQAKTLLQVPDLSRSASPADLGSWRAWIWERFRGRVTGYTPALFTWLTRVCTCYWSSSIGTFSRTHVLPPAHSYQHSANFVAEIHGSPLPSICIYACMYVRMYLKPVTCILIFSRNRWVNSLNIY